MATGRTTTRWMRAYVDGYDLSGYARNIGPLAWTWDEVSIAGLDWPCKGVMLNKFSISPGTLDALWDNTATVGSQIVGNAGNGSPRDVMVPIGIRAAPAAGDQTFMGIFPQLNYQANTNEQVITCTMSFSQWDALTSFNYSKPWGQLIHAKNNETGTNSGTGVESETGAATSLGGWFMWQVFSITGASGSVTLKLQDSADNSTGWADITGLTSGAIAYNAGATSGIAQAATNATIKRYVRWQLVFSSVTACNFALAFCRGS